MSLTPEQINTLLNAVIIVLQVLAGAYLHHVHSDVHRS